MTPLLMIESPDWCQELHLDSSAAIADLHQLHLSNPSLLSQDTSLLLFKTLLSTQNAYAIKNNATHQG